MALLRQVIRLSLFASALLGQTPTPDKPKAPAPESAIQKQRAAARLQVGALADQADAFFLVPFSTPQPKPPQLTVDPDCVPAPKDQIAKLVASTAEKEKVAQNLLEAVIEVESAYDPCAVSPKGAEGLMQLMPSVQEEMSVENPFDPQQNLTAGARHLKKLLEQYKGDLKLALSAYNAGSAKVQNEVPAIAETQDYVARILQKVNPASASPPPPKPAPRK
ncbi:MAG: lytic transglycosylase domain-containing protein [Bryobacteraceae bacterium]